MSEFIRPNRMYGVPIQGGELKISPSHDILHHWMRNGAWMLKYMDQGPEGVNMKNVVLHQEAAEWLITHCDLEVCERTFMSVDGHEHYLQLQEGSLSDLDFDTPDDTIDE